MTDDRPMTGEEIVALLAEYGDGAEFEDQEDVAIFVHLARTGWPRALREVVRLRAKVRELNRRATRAEGAVRNRTQAQPETGGFGRALANAAADVWRRKAREMAKAAREWRRMAEDEADGLDEATRAMLDQVEETRNIRVLLLASEELGNAAREERDRLKRERDESRAHLRAVVLGKCPECGSTVFRSAVQRGEWHQITDRWSCGACSWSATADEMCPGGEGETDGE